MRKYITHDIACTIYKQTILPLFDYANFLVESGQKVYIDRMYTLHVKDLQIIDCKAHAKEAKEELGWRYTLMAPIERRREHHCVMIYRLSKIHDTFRPTMNLRSRNKVKF